MPKGYWIPQIDVSNPDGYKAYMAATPPAHEKYRGNALVRGGKMEVVEGHARSPQCHCANFPTTRRRSPATAPDEYQRARPLRLPHSQCDFLIVEGFDGPQPLQRTPPAAAASKGYWIAHVDVTEPEGYKALSWRADQAPFGQFGGRYLVRGGAQEVPEGKARPHCGDGIPELRCGARLLPLAGLSGGEKAARRQRRSRSRCRRRLRRPEILS